ncbi:Sybindin-like family-domain-containing protein [Exophiala viscosa]|uniref:Sybindin-like family-domain-containing protein n=1 Tax=Exophiala viscosa TaxID=2486360 RepID=UPI00219B8CE2|nr:Sybindin-like family-domain-containing protein [Exophiala viscosa]
MLIIAFSRLYSPRKKDSAFFGKRLLHPTTEPTCICPDHSSSRRIAAPLTAMPVFALLIISKAGSLIFHRTFPTSTPGATANAAESQTQTVGTLGLPGTSTLTTNDYLVLAGTFHGVHAITRSLTPKLPITSSAAGSSGRTWTYPDPTLAPSGIESLESSFFRLTVFQTLTGTKFLLFTDPSMPNTDVLMKGIYERYADFVCKNPFWQMEMPIRIEAWERSVNQWLTRR